MYRFKTRKCLPSIPEEGPAPELGAVQTPLLVDDGKGREEGGFYSKRRRRKQKAGGTTCDRPSPLDLRGLGEEVIGFLLEGSQTIDAVTQFMRGYDPDLSDNAILDVLENLDDTKRVVFDKGDSTVTLDYSFSVSRPHSQSGSDTVSWPPSQRTNTSVYSEERMLEVYRRMGGGTSVPSNPPTETWGERQGRRPPREVGAGVPRS
jgi:hypothetical protein